jgi:hypothetical protein
VVTAPNKSPNQRRPSRRPRKIERKMLLWQIIGTLIALATFFFAIVEPVLDHLHNDIKTETSNAIKNETDPISVRVAKLEANMEFILPYIRSKLAADISSISKQPPTQFTENLPQLQRTLQAARLENVKTDTAVLNELSLKLSKTNQSAQGFWPTAAELVNYRSQNTYPGLAEKVAANRDKFPRCTDSRPTNAEVLSVPNPHQFTTKGAVYQDCRVRLDDPEDDRRINEVLGNVFPFVLFRHCLIEYGGGSITIHLPKDIHNPDRPVSPLSFEKCIFDFSVTSAPSPEGQAVLLALLLNTSGEIDTTGLKVRQAPRR